MKKKLQEGMQDVTGILPSDGNGDSITACASGEPGTLRRLPKKRRIENLLNNF